MTKHMIPTLQFNEFHIPSYEEWKLACEKTLKTGSFEESLQTNTYEGFCINPIYTKEFVYKIQHMNSLPGLSPYVRGTEFLGYTTKPWGVAQAIKNSLPKDANITMCEAITRGQNVINFQLDYPSKYGSVINQTTKDKVGINGISIINTDDIEILFHDVDLEEYPLYISTGPLSFPVFSMIVATLKKKKQDITKLQGVIATDPLGALASVGTLHFPIDKAYDSMALATVWASSHTPKVKTILIESSPYQESGSSIVQELAFTIATAVEYVRELLKRNLTIDTVAKHIVFSFSIGSNIFLEVGKLRAARLLWSKVISAFGGSETSRKMKIHAKTTSFNKTSLDPHINILRCTSESFAAAIGGVDSLQVSPFNEYNNSSDDFSERIARNIQLILQKETHIMNSVDPAGGSYYIECITDEIAKQSWELFQKIESLGGMKEALEEGFVQSSIKSVSEKRKGNLETKVEKMVGVTIFPKEIEHIDSKTNVDRDTISNDRYEVFTTLQKNKKDDYYDSLNKLRITLDHNKKDFIEESIELASKGATLSDFYGILEDSKQNNTAINKLVSFRLTEQFEKLRYASLEIKKKTGELPKVTVIALGTMKDMKKKVDFTIEFFEVGGFIVEPIYVSSDKECMKVINNLHAKIVVFCMLDDVYEEHIPNILLELFAKTKDTTIYLIGNFPKEKSDYFIRLGVRECIYRHSNCFSILSSLQKEKGMIL